MQLKPTDAEQTQLLQALLKAQPVAALATLHKGEPAVSMVPYACYLARLPGREEMFSFGDFSLFVMRIQAVRFVAGFGRAHGLTPDGFANALSSSVSP